MKDLIVATISKKNGSLSSSNHQFLVAPLKGVGPGENGNLCQGFDCPYCVPVTTVAMSS